MNRIAVIGEPGAGKSYVARAIGAALGPPVVHLDLVYWRAGWDPMPADEFVLRVSDELAAERWVCDGNYGSTADMRLRRADTVVWLDLRAPLRIWRLLRRHGKPRPDLPEGCVERRASVDFLKFVGWALRRGRRAHWAAVLERHPHLEVIRLRSRRDVAAFIGSLRRR